MGKKKSHFWKGFKDFIGKGNIIDLAVAVVIGAAFGAIVTAVVNELIMPLIAALFGGATVENLYFTIPAVPWAKFNLDLLPVGNPDNIPDTVGTILSDGTIIKGTPIFYGKILQALINFIIIAFILYVVVKVVIQNKQYKKKIEDEEKAKNAVPAEPVIPEDIKLLTEIRDSLKQINDKNNV
ncbi:MAG: MscL family protein [Acholeplasmatales bacterium]|jgi:large conductance mechanosensitive channel|nr:MscL family protein [Acholeplasmatales bacterium]